MLKIAYVLSIALAYGCANRAGPSIALYEAGDYAGAARAADEGLATHPSDDALWQMRVRAAVALGDRAGIARAYAAHVQQSGEHDHELVRELATATLEQALKSPSAKLKIAAIETIAAARIETLAEAVTERMGDSDDRVVAAAAVAVLRAHPQAPEIADSMLTSENPEARQIALDGISKKMGVAVVAELRAALGDADPAVRRVAIHWLGMLKDKDSFELVLRQLRHPDESVRAAAATALARIGLGNLAALGKQALADKVLSVRLAGLELLIAASQIDALAAVAQRDPHPLVALEAAIAARRSDLAARALARAGSDEDWSVRAGAANTAVRAVGKPKATDLARKLVADADARVRLAAARMLAYVGEHAGAIALFAAALASPELGLQAATELTLLGDPRGTTALDAAVRDDQREGEQRVAAVAAHRSGRVITPGLVSAIADPNGVVRVEAASALIELAK